MDVIKPDARRPFSSRAVHSQLEIVDIATGETRVIRAFDVCVEAPNWMADGRLCYNSQGKLYACHIEDGTVEPIETGYVDRCNNDHVLSPDGAFIGISHQTAEDGRSRVYVVPVGGGTPRLVTPIAPSYLHGWSPDGKTLAYCAERNGDYDVYTIPVEGGCERQLTDMPGLDDGPEYSPDGRYLWFNSVRSGLMQLYRMPAQGGEAERMTFDSYNNWFPHPSPDGRFIAYIAYREGDVAPGDHPANKQVEIRLMPSEGGEARTLVALFGGQGSLNVNSWSPDGSALAFVRYRLAVSP